MVDNPSQQAQWIVDVLRRSGAMSQRRWDVVASWPGGLEQLVGEARARGVHLISLTDDHGVRLIAASVHPFEILS